MVRKQIYITEEQERQLQMLAAESGVSQAEWIRDGIDRMLAEAGKRENVWRELLQEMRSTSVPMRGDMWSREASHARDGNG